MSSLDPVQLTHSLTHHTPAWARWMCYSITKVIRPFIIQPPRVLLPPVLAPFYYVLCLPCLYISACSQQLKPGWSLSRLAGTANLRIVPFIRLASTHNKTPLTRSLKIAARTQCDRVVIALEWASINVLIYFLLLLSIYKFFLPSCSPKVWHSGYQLLKHLIWSFFLFKADEFFFNSTKVTKKNKSTGIFMVYSRLLHILI